MTGDNSTGMKKLRAYDRLICAILEKRPQKLIEKLAGEYVDCPDSVTSFEKMIKEAIEEATKDSKNFYPHRQGGRSVLVYKDCPLGRKLAKGAFSPANEEA